MAMVKAMHTKKRYMPQNLNLTVWVATLAATMLLACNKTDAGGVPEAAIRKNLADRLPNLPKIEEVRKSPIAGLYEVRVGEADIFYTDAQGDYLVHGSILDTKARRDLTRERVDKLTAIDFSALPVQDAMVTKRGTGARKLAVFEDPNCPYCHRFEADLAKVDNVTVYTFLLPVLGPDSLVKSQNIWCAADRNKAWDDWMLRQTPPPKAPDCNIDAIKRNVEFSRKHQITGTPTLVFANGSRIASALKTEEINKQIEEASR